MVTKRRKRFTTVELLQIVVRSSGHCGICEGIVEPGSEAVDHIVPLARGGEDRAENCQLAHRSCNAKKHARLQEELIGWQLEAEAEEEELRAIIEAREQSIIVSDLGRDTYTASMDDFTVAEAAAALGIGERAVLARIARGDLRATRRGGKLWLIPASEVERAKANPIKHGPRLDKRGSRPDRAHGGLRE